MPSIPFHLPDDQVLAKALAERVKRDKKSRSKWIAEVVEKELRGGGIPPALAPDIIVQLTKQLSPLEVDAIERAMAGKSQPEELRKAIWAWAKLEMPKRPELDATLEELVQEKRSRKR